MKLSLNSFLLFGRRIVLEPVAGRPASGVNITANNSEREKEMVFDITKIFNK